VQRKVTYDPENGEIPELSVKSFHWSSNVLFHFICLGPRTEVLSVIAEWLPIDSYYPMT
jgi:hypothetical protein